MIRFEANNWHEAWVELHRLYAEEPEQTIDRRFATRATSFNNEIVIKENDVAGLHIGLVGYTQFKLNLFDYRYVIPGMREKILNTLSERLEAGRKLSVISNPFREDDGAHTQGPCLINMIITVVGSKDGWVADFDIYLRIGEITRRMLVDFMKFQQLVQFYLDGLSQYNVQLGTITVHSKVIYAESISLTIAEHLFTDKFSYNMDHWLHRDVQKKIARFNEGDIKFKRGRRIRKAMINIQKGQHE